MARQCISGEQYECQSCHVPVATGADGHAVSDYIAHRRPGGVFPPSRPRSPIGVQSFIGANVQMLRFLGSVAGSSGFSKRADATLRFLRSAVALDATAQVTGGDVRLAVTVRNLTGHKLPTGLPGRRLWLHVTAFDPNNRTIFESGAWDPETGELRHARAFDIHRDAILEPEHTAIYEAVMEDARGDLTTRLTHAVGYRKDNRLLPAGFDKGSRLPEGVMPLWLAPVGTQGDADFGPGCVFRGMPISVPG